MFSGIVIKVKEMGVLWDFDQSKNDSSHYASVNVKRVADIIFGCVKRVDKVRENRTSLICA